MPLTAAQLNTMSTKTRQAYHNAGDGYTGLLQPPVFFGPFSFNRIHGNNIAVHQSNWQIFVSGSWDPDITVFVPAFTSSSPDPTYPLDLTGLYTLWDQFGLEADYGPPTLRAKYNVQKSYWTGIHRRRRNL